MINGLLEYLKSEFSTTRAGFLSGVACGAAAASLLIASLNEVTDTLEVTEIIFILGWFYLILAWLLSRIDHKQRMRDLLRIPEKYFEKS